MANTMVGQNFTASLEKDTLTIIIDLGGATTPSASGKTNVVASTRGNKVIPGTNPEAVIGLNVYFKK